MIAFFHPPLSLFSAFFSPRPELFFHRFTGRHGAVKRIACTRRFFPVDPPSAGRSLQVVFPVLQTFFFSGRPHKAAFYAQLSRPLLRLGLIFSPLLFAVSPFLRSFLTTSVLVRSLLNCGKFPTVMWPVSFSIKNVWRGS